MSYSRSCGVSLAACGANKCRCDKSHVGALGGREKPVQRFDLSVPCAHCGWVDDCCDFRCCCTHENPMQATYDTTRRDA